MQLSSLSFITHYPVLLLSPFSFAICLTHRCIFTKILKLFCHPYLFPLALITSDCFSAEDLLVCWTRGILTQNGGFWQQLPGPSPSGILKSKFTCRCCPCSQQVWNITSYLLTLGDSLYEDKPSSECPKSCTAVWINLGHWISLIICMVSFTLVIFPDFSLPQFSCVSFSSIFFRFKLF